MDEDVMRRLVRGALTLLLTTLATWLAGALTERLLGPDPHADVELAQGRDYEAS